VNPAPIATLPQSTPPPASVLGIVVNIVLGVAELAGFGVWLLLTFAVGAVSSSQANPGPETEALVYVGTPGLLPFGIAAVFNGLGVWKGSKGARGASLGWACAAFVVGLIPWGVVLWFAMSVNLTR